jgi:hypothetical protein
VYTCAVKLFDVLTVKSTLLESVAHFRFLEFAVLGTVLNILFVPRSKLSVSVINNSQLMLYREIIAVCSDIHTYVLT